MDWLEQVPISNSCHCSCFRRECRIIIVNLTVWCDMLRTILSNLSGSYYTLKIGLDSSHSCTRAVVIPLLFVFLARSSSILKSTKLPSGIDTPPSCSNELQWWVIQFSMKDITLSNFYKRICLWIELHASSPWILLCLLSVKGEGRISVCLAVTSFMHILL